MATKRISNLYKTKSCNKCTEFDTNEMVQCDDCSQWYHFSCAGVTEEIEFQPWKCESCALTKEQSVISEQSNNTSQQGTQKTAVNQTFSTSSSKKRNLQLQKLEEERQLELNAANQKIALEKKFLDKKYEILSSCSSRTSSNASTSENYLQIRTEKWVNQILPLPGSAKPFVNNTKMTGAHMKERKVNSAVDVQPKQQRQLSPIFGTPHTNNNVEEELLNSRQISARHAISKELPTFSGKPEEWPLFISTFEDSTKTCGFTNAENLLRLQKSLKGKALEVTRNRLLLPQGVPQAIQTLRMLFGRPEIIIQSLLEKIRSEPPPRTERLESVIHYSLAVQNLCTTMEASNLTDHLVNPILLQELVDRLPPQMKLDWAMAKRELYRVDISQFNNWLYDIAQLASEVTIPSFHNLNEIKISRKGKQFAGPHSNDLSTNKNNEKIIPANKLTLKPATKAKTCVICSGKCLQVPDCGQFKNMSYNDKWAQVKLHRLCRKCLATHHVAFCKSRGECGIHECKYKHHPLLHNPSYHVQDKSTNADTERLSIHQKNRSDLLFRIVPVKLFGKEITIETYAFLDEGSSVTLIEEEIAKSLDLEGIVDPLCLRWTADTIKEERESRRTRLTISGVSCGSKIFQINNARTVGNLNLPLQSVDSTCMKDSYPYLKGLPIPTYTDVQPKILIGLDNWRLGIPLRFVEGKPNQPVATKTRLGWIIHGLQQSWQSNKTSTHHFHVCDCKPDENLNQIVQEYFSQDNFAVKVRNIESLDNLRAKEIFDHTTMKVNNRYETGLLWKSENIVLPDNFIMAKRRLDCLRKKLSNDPVLREKMNDQIQQHISKGYARKLTKQELREHSSKIWYLPIFPVTKSSKPDKIRIVFDAAAQVDGTSLNSCLLKGPDELVPLPTVLTKFREGPIAISGDIKEMFHQVLIRKEDQNSQRFLWYDEKTSEIHIYVMQVMTFGASCSPSSAQYVKNKNAELWLEKYPRASTAITERHYVDDYLDSMDNDSEAIKLAKEVTFIHKNAGFQIRNWTSNSQAVQSALNGTDQSKNLDIQSHEPTEKVLGMMWETSTDTFTYSTKYKPTIRDILRNEKRPTKREVLKIVMSIFDPLGLLSSFLIYAKILLQEIWRAKLEWDDPIKDEHFEKWLRWIHLLPIIEQVHIPRCFTPNRTKDGRICSQLHIFVDASENAYAATVYLRTVYPDEIYCSLVMAKAKVAPLKPMSIPRLELQAAVLGTRLANSITETLGGNVNQRFFWSDSKTILYWLNGDPRKFRQFVAFRIGEIQEFTKMEEWHWVPSKLNVADEATKWIQLPDLKTDGRWFSGPSFLKEPELLWPNQDWSFYPDQVNQDEIRPCHLHNTAPTITTIDFHRFSKWKRLVRTQAYVLRFAYNIMAKKRQLDKMFQPLASEELRRAEAELFKIAQSEIYAKEINLISNQKLLGKWSSLYKLSPLIDENGVLRHKGRIDAARFVDNDAKQPIILPPHHYISKLIVDHYHDKYKHQNYETVVNELRQKFQIPRLRVLVKSSRATCQYCRNRDARPRPPEMANLPSARLSAYTQPFSFVGIDYFGPINVQVRRVVEKRWGVLFTCLTVRAIHIEIAHSLTTDSCIMALRNFIARHGPPLEWFSDNGTNLVGANNELTTSLKSVNHNKLQEAFTTATTKWNFNPPSAPHMGGSWERLIGSVKKIFYQILPTRNPTDEVLRSLLMEVEMIVNSRPLTYVPLDDVNDEALTPNHFLLGTSNGAKTPGEFCDRDLLLRKQWRIVQQLANEFWRKWIREYLPTLTKRTKWFTPAKPIVKGDIVIIVDENSPRNTWPKGIVEEAKPSPDGQVRKVVIRTTHGVLTRPAVKVAVLDVGRSKSSPCDDLLGGSVVMAHTFPIGQEKVKNSSVWQHCRDDSLTMMRNEKESRTVFVANKT